jgi:hypothetical protein
MGTIISFEDFAKKSKGVSLEEDTLMTTGAPTVFVDKSEEDHGGEEKNYMFFKNLYTMKKCIDEIMAMNKDQVDELIEKGHDWASDHISSSKDDIQEVCDWLRYEIENREEEEEGEEGEGEDDNITVDIEGNDDNVEIEDEEGEGEDDDDDEEEEEEEEEETSESNFSYEEEKN